jgi:hypothetical protein
LVRGEDPDPAPDPSPFLKKCLQNRISMQNFSKK